MTLTHLPHRSNPSDRAETLRNRHRQDSIQLRETEAHYRFLRTLDVLGVSARYFLSAAHDAGAMGGGTNLFDGLPPGIVPVDVAIAESTKLIQHLEICGADITELAEMDDPRETQFPGLFEIRSHSADVIVQRYVVDPDVPEEITGLIVRIGSLTSPLVLMVGSENRFAWRQFASDQKFEEVRPDGYGSFDSLWTIPATEESASFVDRVKVPSWVAYRLEMARETPAKAPLEPG